MPFSSKEKAAEYGRFKRQKKNAKQAEEDEALYKSTLHMREPGYKISLEEANTIKQLDRRMKWRRRIRQQSTASSPLSSSAAVGEDVVEWRKLTVKELQEMEDLIRTHESNDSSGNHWCPHFLTFIKVKECPECQAVVDLAKAY